MFKGTAQQLFGTAALTSAKMEGAIRYWWDIYSGNPDWVDPEEGIRTIKFAKAICSETARLTTLAIGVEFDGSRAEYMDNWNQAAVMPNLRKWMEYACAFGTVVLKPNGTGVDFVTPDNFEITDIDGKGVITGMRFQDRYSDGDRWYTKLEQHRFDYLNVQRENGSVVAPVYVIQNRAFVSENEGEIGVPCDLSTTKWAMLQPEVHITKRSGEKIDSMLFGVLKVPDANDIDLDGPLGMAIFAGAVEELKDLDVAYSRNAQEIFDSQSIEILGDMLVKEPGKKINTPMDVRLPHHVRMIPGTSGNDFYQAIDRPLKTDERIKGMNNLLDIVGYKCGYSNGYFAFDEKTGMVTATQVESDDRRTIQLIKDVRDALRKCLDDLYYAQSVFADLFGLAPVGDYKTTYDFGDITYNEDEDRARWWQYVTSGKVPFWRYLVKFEGFSEEGAKAISAEAKEDNKAEGGLFGEE